MSVVVTSTFRLLIAGAGAALIASTASTASARSTQDSELWREVEIIRTEHGVPHIRASTLRAGVYGLAWVMSEDYGPRTAINILRASGGMGRVFGRDSIESDFAAWRDRQRAVETYHLLDESTRDVYRGFAEGLNRFIALRPTEFPPGMPRFSAYDVAALDIGGTSGGALRAYRRLLDPAARDSSRRGSDDVDGQQPENVGSNAWAFAPSRTKSGRAILLRNPHLAWNASDSTSRWHADQAERFARGDLKRVAFTQQDIDSHAVERYRPGEAVEPPGPAPGRPRR